MNLYEYVGDSPLTRTDPTGLENFYVCGQVVARREESKDVALGHAAATTTIFTAMKVARCIKVGAVA